MGAAAGPSALPLDVAAGRCGVWHPLGDDQTLGYQSLRALTVPRGMDERFRRVHFMHHLERAEMNDSLDESGGRCAMLCMIDAEFGRAF